jgi:phospholipase/carboxylesterase
MTRKLAADRRPPASGRLRNVVIFLHGYGADGSDLLGLAEPLSPHLPDTLFLAPDAPERCLNNPFGYQWFPVPWLDGSSEAAAAEGMARAVADLDAYLDEVLEKEAVTPEQIALFGFSQGTMMALHVGPRRSPGPACIVGFSGRLLVPERLASEAASRPPVLLLHGDSDEMVPPSSLNEAAEALTREGFETYAHVMRGTGHGIAPDGLSLALAFLRDKLPG